MSEAAFGGLKGGRADPDQGNVRLGDRAGEVAARAEYSRVQRLRGAAAVEHCPPTRICCRSLAPMRTMTAAGFSASMMPAIWPRPVEMILPHETRRTVGAVGDAHIRLGGEDDVQAFR